MATILLGNQSVIEKVKKDPDGDDGPGNIRYASRKALGSRVTTMHLNETDMQDRPNRAMNLNLVTRFWADHSDKPPAWVDGDDDLLVQLVADHFGCQIGRPKTWKEG